MHIALFFLTLFLLGNNISVCEMELESSSLKINPGQQSVRNSGKKSFLTGISINPYDPIARVTNTGFWRKLIKPVFHSTIENYYDTPPSSSSSTTTTKRSTTTTTTFTPSSQVTNTNIPSMKPVLTTTKVTMQPTKRPTTPKLPSGDITVMTSTTLGKDLYSSPSPLSTESPLLPTNITIGQGVEVHHPTTDQLLDCIDWLLEWLQSNVSLPLKSKGHIRDG